ncbi:MAG TPA: hypothetical protein VMU41_16075 [Candidatus Binataceae bacterium]|nr:hypothetical protein [Candidatus Binataceae bacterium]
MATRRMAATIRVTAALVVASLLSVLSGRADAQKARLIPAFIGGVRKDALLKDPQAIIDISSHCYDAAAKAQDVSAATEECIDNELKRKGASIQAITFANFAPVPSAIEHFASYHNAAAVYAVMRWADGASGWCLIGKSGEAVGMWEPTGAEHDPKFAAFERTHPNVSRAVTRYPL